MRRVTVGGEKKAPPARMNQKKRPGACFLVGKKKGKGMVYHPTDPPVGKKKEGKKIKLRGPPGPKGETGHTCSSAPEKKKGKRGGGMTSGARSKKGKKTFAAPPVFEEKGEG